MLASTTSSVLWSMQSRRIFTRATAEKEEREDMFYLSVDEAGGDSSTSSSADGDSDGGSDSSDGLLYGASPDGGFGGGRWAGADEEGWEDPDPTWVVDENEEAMRREWHERQQRQAMLRKRADIKRRLKAERQRRAAALEDLNAYHRRTHGPGRAAAGNQSGSVGGVSVGWNAGVVDEEYDLHREEEMHERKRDSLALGKLRASMLLGGLTEGSGTLQLSSSGSGSGLGSGGSAIKPRRSSTNRRSQQLRPSALSYSRTFTSTAAIEDESDISQSSGGTTLMTIDGSLMPTTPRATIRYSIYSPRQLSKSDEISSSSSSSSSFTTSTALRVSDPAGGTGSRERTKKKGSKRRHSRSFNAVPEEDPKQRIHISERPRSYSAGAILPSTSRDELRRQKKQEKKERKEKEKREKRERQKEKNLKEKAEREKRSTGRGAKLIRVISGGKLRTSMTDQNNKIKRGSFTAIDPALLSDSAVMDNPYIEQYRNERKTPRGDLSTAITPLIAAEEKNAAKAALHRSDGIRNHKELTFAVDAIASRRAVEWDSTTQDKPISARKSESPRSETRASRVGKKQRSNSVSAIGNSSAESASTVFRNEDLASESPSKPHIPTLSLTLVAAASSAEPGSVEKEKEAESSSSLSSKLGAMTPRMMEGFRSIVKKLSKNPTSGEDVNQENTLQRTHNVDSEESPLSYSGSDSGSDSSETEEAKQRRQLRRRKLEKKRSKSERILRSRSMSPGRDRVDSISAPRTLMRTGSHREQGANKLAKAPPRKAGSERRLRLQKSSDNSLITRPYSGSSSIQENSAPSSPSSSYSSSSSSHASPSPLQRRRSKQTKDDVPKDSSSDLGSSSERHERRGRTMVRRAGDTWGNFLARLSPRISSRNLHSTTSSPNINSSGEASPSSRSGSKREERKKKHKRTLSEAHLDLAKDDIGPRNARVPSRHLRLVMPLITCDLDHYRQYPERIRSRSERGSKRSVTTSGDVEN